MLWFYWGLFAVVVAVIVLSLIYGKEDIMEVKKYMSERLNQDGSINENWLAEEITRREVGKSEVNIAQVKDVLNATLKIMAEEYSTDQVEKLLIKHSG
jgi:hypothetical protein